jgi:ribosomal protein S18 acetylase RimI-like enzyme
MIHELACYENEPTAVQATEESLLRTLTFAPSPTSTPSASASSSSSSSHSPSSPSPGYAKTLLLRAPSSDSHGAAEEVAGMALFFTNYSTWRGAPGIYLEDLFVRPAFRKRGYGKLLIRALARECKEIGGVRLEWCCLKWNESSLEFYRALGAREQVEWVTLRVDGERLEALAK